MLGRLKNIAALELVGAEAQACKTFSHTKEKSYSILTYGGVL